MRLRPLRAIANLSFAVLLGGLILEQIVRGDIYRNRSESNRIRLVPILNSRGRLCDRNGTILAADEASFDVVAAPQDLMHPDETFSWLSSALGCSSEDLRRTYRSGFVAPFAPIALKKNIDRERAFKIEELSLDRPGIYIQTRPLRQYIYKEAAANITGYLAMPHKEDLMRLKEYGYRAPLLIGRAGIERTYDEELRGSLGGIQVEVNNRGRAVNVIGRKEAIPGEDITLTIDIRLQDELYRLMKGQRGSAVVIEPNSGEVLALVSHPMFDPNKFLMGDSESQREVASLLKSEDSPFLNRAIECAYPPGSIFKIVTAVAALEMGKATPGKRFLCRGKLAIGNRNFRCWKEAGHGPEDLHNAIVHSCNIYFYSLGQLLGADELYEFAVAFGLGSPSGIELVGEEKGFVPSRWWKHKTYHEPWYDGDSANFAIGQGRLAITPLQAARMVAAFANGGYLVHPYVVRKAQGPLLGKGEKLQISAQALSVIKDAMRDVVADDTGTGQLARVGGLEFAAKTGTAQTASGEPPHAWFVGFAPFDEPKIAFSVILEHGGMGGVEPAHIVKEMLEFYSALEGGKK